MIIVILFATSMMVIQVEFDHDDDDGENHDNDGDPIDDDPVLQPWLSGLPRHLGADWIGDFSP